MPQKRPSTSRKTKRPAKRGVMHDLGAFFGEIVKGIKADPSHPQTRIVKRIVKEAEAPGGKAILRRTIVDEVVIPPVKRRRDP